METRKTAPAPSKSFQRFLRGQSRSARLVTSTRIAVVLVLLTVGVNFKHASLESLPLAPPGPGPLQKNTCITSAQRRSGGATTDGEYLPAYSPKPVPHSAASGRKYVGYHCWREINAISHTLRWESDAVNTMNDFIVCRYDLDSTTAKEVYLQFGGGRVDFTNKDGSGTGGGLMLAVYEGGAPTTLFKGNAINFGTPAFGPKKWTKLEKVSWIAVDPLNVPVKVRPGVKVLSVVLVGVDPWIDTKVSIQIESLKVLSKPTYVRKR